MALESNERSCGLGTSTASTCVVSVVAVAAASSLGEAATTLLERATSVSLTGLAATASQATTATVDVGISTGLQAALLDNDMLIADLVWVGVQGSLVTLGRLEVDKGAVLTNCQ